MVGLVDLLLAILVVGGGPSTAFGKADAAALEMPLSVADLLATGTWRDTAAGFRIIALSHVADGCAAQAAAHPTEARRCVARLLVLAAPLAPAGWKPLRAGEYGVYAGHLNLILGAQDAVGGPHDAALHAELSYALADRSAHEPTHHLASFARSPLRWPADQSATLASLRRFDRAHNGHLAGAAGAAWRDWLEGHATAGGLPWSEATGRAKHARLPRGCALSYSIRYTAEFDPPLAERWWKAYRARYLVDRLVVAGFREWPPGLDLPADQDSGPIIGGVGASATAFGLSAARAVGDDVTAGRLGRTSTLIGGVAALDGGLARLRRSTLAQAILFEASSRAPRSAPLRRRERRAPERRLRPPSCARRRRSRRRSRK